MTRSTTLSTSALVASSAAVIVAASLSTVALVTWLQQPARAEVNDTDLTTATIADESRDFVVPYKGYVMLDSTPLHGQVDLVFGLHERDDTTGVISTTAEWTETQTVTAYDGQFHVGLGMNERLTEDLLDGDALFLQIGIDDGSGTPIPLGGYQQIEASPYAIWSAHAADLAVAGSATLGSTLAVDTLADYDADGDITVSGTLAPIALMVDGDLQVDTAFTIQNSATLGNDDDELIHIMGSLQLDNRVNLGDDTAEPVTVTGALTVGDDLTVDAHLFDIGVDGNNDSIVRTNGALTIATDRDDSASSNDQLFDLNRGSGSYPADILFRLTRGGSLSVDGELTVGDDLSVESGTITVDSGILGLNRKISAPIRIHNVTSQLDVSGTGERPRGWQVTSSIGGISCNSSYVGSMVVSQHTGSVWDALCYCGYNGNVPAYRWLCFSTND